MWFDPRSAPARIENGAEAPLIVVSIVAQPRRADKWPSREILLLAQNLCHPYVATSRRAANGDVDLVFRPAVARAHRVGELEAALRNLLTVPAEAVFPILKHNLKAKIP